ncbi:MAG: PIN domain-containing protein [Nitrospirales bacterium]
MRNTFVKYGLRLLVPAMMERELLRHFRTLATEAAEAISKAHSQHPIDFLSLLELPSTKELEERCVEVLQKQWEEFKEHFTVEQLPLAGRLDDVVDWYFQIEPPFAKGKKSKEFPDAFILSVLEEYHRDHGARIAVISHDNDFKKACAKRSFIHHFEDLSQYIDAFRPELSKTDDDEIIDPTKPITTEDLTEMKAILGRGTDITEIERNRVVHLLSARGTNYDYFFRHANDALWIDPLVREGFFANPPLVEKFDDGRIRTPIWRPMDYLVRVFEQAPDRVVEVLESLPNTDNAHILEGFLEIIVKSDDPELVKRFYSRIITLLDVARWGHERIIELLSKPYLFQGQLADIAPILLLKIVEFRPDPAADEKGQRRKEDASDWTATLEPAPRIDAWEYEQILDRGISPLAEREPFAVARMLIDATASMIRLSTHREDLQKDSDEDLSEIWCRRLDRPERDIEGPKVGLVHALTTACQFVYNNAPESIDALDQALRNQRWKVFRRLRQLLYARNPNERTRPWIREFILTHEDYGRWDHHYEFQLMIRKACDHFGTSLLTEKERSTIFDTILSGPSEDNFREWMSDGYTDEAWTQRQRYFHHKQLRPFASVLFGDYRTTYDELESELSGDPLTDESFSPVGESRSGFVSNRSPFSVEDLAALSDEDLLTSINEWDESRRDSDDWLIEISIEALAEAFQTVFKDVIVPDAIRLTFWLDNRERIERPVYVKAMARAMQDITKAQQFEQLDKWLEFCGWILQRPNDARYEEDWGNDESRETPDWRSCRRVVGDFIGSCLETDINAPFTFRDILASLLRTLCTQFDYRLDSDRPVLLNRDDQVTEAINNTRSRALEDLVDFGYWVRRHEENAEVPELVEILECRFAYDVTHPLTLPERALLGYHFGSIWNLNNDWVEANIERFFPHDDLSIWVEVFSAFIRFNRPFRPTFDILRDEFVFALAHIDNLDITKNSERESTDTLGQHLFTYYLWDVYPLQGEDSLLNVFYDNTSNDRIHWRRLFEYVGRTLHNSGPTLNETIHQQILAFFYWRFDQKEPEELQEFTFWLKSACLDPDWRLDAYSMILDLPKAKNIRLSIELDMLNELLEQHTAKVVECFAKITDHVSPDGTFYIETGKAKSILQAGLKSADESVRTSAERARENLLEAGRFEFLETEE